jgi:hypothetical protein
VSEKKLTPLESAVLEKMLTGDEPVFEIIKQQLAASTVTKRELTGTGFFTHFVVQAQTKILPDKGRLMIGDVSAKIPGLEIGADFILWMEEGVISFLEGFTYDESWPTEITSFELLFVNERPAGSGKLFRSDTRDLNFALRRLDSTGS